MISHARVKLFIVSEVSFAILLSLLILMGARWYGLQGAAAGYAFGYAIYWLLMHWQCKRLALRLTASPTTEGAK
jgi:O-antigen/teichoic acid export membrane protein